ncbi:MAG: hypothetical protein ICV84_25140 [Flavisolibacter sp.]|nr:hypothetical protein [Flavisolibacter sp.]
MKDKKKGAAADTTTPQNLPTIKDNHSLQPPANKSTSLICRNCDPVEAYHTIKKANNPLAYCSVCGAFIKNLSYDVPRLYIGKYAGTPISEIEDLSYLRWVLHNMKLSKSIREAVIERIRSLSITHR